MAAISAPLFGVSIKYGQTPLVLTSGALLSEAPLRRRRALNDLCPTHRDLVVVGHMYRMGDLMKAQVEEGQEEIVIEPCAESVSVIGLAKGRIPFRVGRDSPGLGYDLA